ncbi:protein regulator of cytokinesis 1-like [Spea bombifrons]|uniref:protein regulator of cytokinesis 1-like n=1 Tax=Spea bombifrons TaxID=233779 RepID=UPI00234AD18F|nr:protein regulator of cytokinesis 1-like [Spea bombifrons]
MPRGTRKSELLASSLITSMNHTFARLMDIWDELGLLEEKRMMRMEEVKHCVERLLSRMINEEMAMKDRIERSILNSKKELEILSHELSLEEYKLDEGMTVLQMEKDLRVKLELLRIEKNERLEELRKLQEEDQDLCSELFVTPYYIPTGCMPSREQLEELKEHIKLQTEEKKQRMLIFSNLRSEIRHVLEEMGREPQSDLEQDAICGNEEDFTLTTENIKALKLLKEHLELKKESLLFTLNEIKEKVQVLWNRLQVPKEEQDTYLHTPKCPISTAIKQWENELLRLEELKKSNLKEVILRIREELKVYWDKCFYSTEQRNVFAPYYDDDFTEELLSQHDEEVVRMKRQYEKCKEMLDAVNKWESSWEQFVILEKKASDPNRFSNRGGSLLKEEKERMKLQKLLSKLEEELKTRIEAWEAEQGSPFLLKGHRFMDYVASQWENLKLQKEKEKQERTHKKEDSIAFKTPVKRPAGSCTQGTPSNKTRKLNGTTSIMSRTTVSAKTPLPTIKTPSKTKETPVRTPLHDSNKQTSMSSSQPGTYSEFKEAISRKSNKDVVFNSTVNENL